MHRGSSWNFSQAITRERNGNIQAIAGPCVERQDAKQAQVDTVDNSKVPCEGHAGVDLQAIASLQHG